MDYDELETVEKMDTTQTTREFAAMFDISIPAVLDHLKRIGKTSGQVGTIRPERASNETLS